jgi:hypothetical protein
MSGSSSDAAPPPALERALQRLRPRVRQPADPVPLGAGPGLGEQHDAHVAGAVQHGGLGRHPGGQRSGQLAPAGEADDAALGEGHRHRRVERLPGHLALVAQLLRVAQDDLGGQVRRRHPQHQEVGVVAAPLPQAGPRAGGDQQRLGRIGRLRPAPGPLRQQRLLGVPLGRRLGLLVAGQLLAVLLARAGPAAHPVADRHDRAHRGEDRVAQAAQHQHQHHGHEDRRQDGQDRQAPSAWHRRRLGQLEGRLAQRRQQPGRPVVVQRDAVLRRLERGVGR